MPPIPTPGELAEAGGWVVAVFVLLAVLAIAFWLLRELWKREFKRSDALADELRETKIDLAEANRDRLRLVRLVESYGASDDDLARHRRPTNRGSADAELD